MFLLQNTTPATQLSQGRELPPPARRNSGHNLPLTTRTKPPITRAAIHGVGERREKKVPVYQKSVFAAKGFSLSWMVCPDSIDETTQN